MPRGWEAGDWRCAAWGVRQERGRDGRHALELERASANAECCRLEKLKLATEARHDGDVVVFRSRAATDNAVGRAAAAEEQHIAFTQQITELVRREAAAASLEDSGQPLHLPQYRARFGASLT